MRRLVGFVATSIVLMLAWGTAASAHPLGNFTLNHLSRLTVANGAVRVRYVLDMAEIPAFSLDRSLDPHGKPPPAALAVWARSHAAEIAPQLHLAIDGRPAGLVPVGSSVQQRPGAGGLPTIYFVATYTAALDAGSHRLAYSDGTEADRIGWKDVVLGTTAEPTHELRSYPSDLISSPRALTAVTADVDPRGRLSAVAGAPNAAAADAPPAGAALTRMDALSDILTKGATSPLVVIGGLLLAIVLGAAHAVEPGHGKTLLAVSLVGARATTRQALILAVALTVAHTAGVLVLGVVLLFVARSFATERLYAWIAIGSGAIVTVLGGRAVAREVRLRLPFAHAHVHAHPQAQPHAHDHTHELGGDHHERTAAGSDRELALAAFAAHTHEHGTAGHTHGADGHTHGHQHAGGHEHVAGHSHAGGHDHSGLDDEAHALAHAIPGTAPLTFRSAVVAAASGNVAPCPAALVVLFAAVNFHQIGFGLALIVAFSIGLAGTLTTLGIAVVRGAAWLTARPEFDRFARAAPLVTACVISVVGAAMIGRGFVDAGIATSAPLVAGLVLLAVAGYAFAWHQHGSLSEVPA